ncbi:MAG: hypothetical protein AAF614_06630 [Chloroflexota bacterium]
MDRFYVFIIRNDVWIYILCGLGLFWYTSEFLRALRILRQAVFGLERETGTQLRNNSLFFMVLCATIIGGVYFVNNQVAPTLPPILFQLPTPTPDIFATPLSSPTPLGTPDDIVTATPAIAPTVTLASEPNIPLVDEPVITDTLETAVDGTPTAVPTPFVDCPPDLTITGPRDGAIVSGLVTFNGTADPPNFRFYSISANGPQTNGLWADLLGSNVTQAVRNDFLGDANLSQWESGPYLIQLTAVDTSGNPIGSCVIQVTLAN